MDEDLRESLLSIPGVSLTRTMIRDFVHREGLTRPHHNMARQRRKQQQAEEDDMIS